MLTFIINGFQDQEENNESDLESNDDNKQEQQQQKQAQQPPGTDAIEQPQQDQQPDNKTVNYSGLTTIPTIGGWPSPAAAPTPSSTPVQPLTSASMDGNGIPRLSRQLFSAYTSTGGVIPTGNVAPPSGSGSGGGGSGSGANSETESSAQETGNAETNINGLTNSLDHMKVSMEKVIKKAS